MFKIFLLLSFLFSVALCAVEVDVVSITKDKNSYKVYDRDILFTNEDKIQFSFISEKDTDLEIEYFFKNKLSKLTTMKLKKDKKVNFPEEDFLNFDQEGDVVFVFKSKNQIKKLHLKYLKTSTKKSNQSIQDIKYALDPNEIISNSRGLKEKEAYNHLIKSTVVVETSNEIGAGVVISKDGKILTNYHVIKNKQDINIAFKPKSKYATNPTKNSFLKTKILKIDPIKDLALLEILDKSLIEDIEAIKLSTLDEVDIGEDIYVMGHPQKEYFTLGWGTVSSVR